MQIESVDCESKRVIADTKKECNVNCFDFFFFSVFFMIMGGKITINLKELH